MKKFTHVKKLVIKNIFFIYLFIQIYKSGPSKIKCSNVERLLRVIYITNVLICCGFNKVNTNKTVPK